MKLKADIDYSDLLAEISRCAGDVFFDTEAGDHLNLKSTLSQFVFTTAVLKDVSKKGGRLSFEEKDDRRKLERFFEEE